MAVLVLFFAWGCYGAINPKLFFQSSLVSPSKFISWSGHDGLLKVQLQGQGAGGAHPW
jgi:hypothetical protein